MICSQRIVRPGVLAVICGTLISVPLFVSSLHGQEAPSSRPSGRGAASLSTDMRDMQSAWGKIKAQISDPTKNDSTLDLLSQFESRVALAKMLLPPNVASMPEADQKAAADKYRGMLRDLLHKSLDLEDELIAGDNAKAAETVAAMGDIEKAGHAEFRGRGRS